MTRAVVGRAVVVAIVLLIAGRAASAELLSREEALKLAFPGATFAPERVFLTPEQQKRAADLAGEAPPTALIARYIATKEGAVVGRAYVDTHTVRTKKETLLVSLGADGKVRRVDATAFLEPSEYRAPEAFMNQYTGRALSEDLRMQRAIRPIAGATLTAHAVTEAVRRVLAIDAVLK